MNALWFRRDLRLTDNYAMYALENELEYDKKADWFAFYHVDPVFLEEKCLHHHYFFQQVRAFERECREKGITLHFIYGSRPFQTLLSAVPELSAVYFNEDEAAWEAERDKAIQDYLHENGVQTYAYPDAHFHHSGDVMKKDGSPYKIFTPYFRAWQMLPKPRPYPCCLERFQQRQADPDLQDTHERALQEMDTFDAAMNREASPISESEAIQKMNTFIHEDLSNYENSRDIPAEEATSRLSPLIKTGRLSVRTIYSALEPYVEQGSSAAQKYLAELAWRDFYNMIHAHFPDLKKKEMNEKYRNMQWEYQENQWERWKNGMTGFPFVDAAMRQLNSEGWLHNRGRMAAASFLVKDYHIDWKLGEDYFRRQLIDYDPSSNAGGWQWTASTGSDAAPYFRVFSPVRQSKRFDPDGIYIKTHVPELNHVPVRFIHEPWKMDDAAAEKAACLPGHDYPLPDVTHKTAAQQAIEMFKGDRNV
ncbi:cryptochrome/photolyase family protein [Salibacterium qingdaonense]|uniref:Deoxyribodipyrimidine photo-lyase n=1 Tax=Salibacterium qingdaonense TaxID=266892 RepID=A0A1I4ITG2_9BACI|nr:deoxyribodipyrimidine photo-lyase [Salibacterium qingdaonense]SFL57590.1 deoxyribodipyrimidine photo-lyase [Salibacterium qingdaonense]